MIKKATKFIFLGLFIYAFAGNNAVMGQEQSEVILSSDFNGWSENSFLNKFGNGYLYITAQVNTDDDQNFKFRVIDLEKDDNWYYQWGRDNQVLSLQQKHEVWAANGDRWSPEDMKLQPTSGKYYTFTMQEPTDDYETNTYIMIQETSAEPVAISSVTQFPAIGSVELDDDVTVTVVLSAAPSAEERFYVRYAVDNDWDNTVQSKLDFSDGDGTTASVVIPAQGLSEVNYYVFSTTIDDIDADFDLATINLNNNGGENYVYSAEEDEPVIGWETIDDGDWSSADTWNLALVPPTDVSMGSVTVTHEVMGNQDAIIDDLNITEEGSIYFQGDTDVTIGGGEFFGTVEFDNLTIKGGVHFGENATVKSNLTIDGGYLRVAGDLTGISDEKYIPDYEDGATLIYAGANFGYDENNFAGAFGESDEKRPTNLTINDGSTVSLNAPLRKISGTLTVSDNAVLNTGNQLFLLAGSKLVNKGEINDRARFQQKIEGNEGWRMLSSPTTHYGDEGGNLTYNSLLNQQGSKFWIQGMFEGDQGGHTSFGEPNIRYYDTATNDFVGIQKAYDDLTPGQGFIFYVYNVNPDDWTGEEAGDPVSGEGAFTKYMEIEGAVVQNDVEIDLNKDAGGATLLGNPFAFAIDWDDVKAGTNDITESIYVYDPSYNNVVNPDFEDENVGGGYRTWNGTAGSFNGKIAPFQGFWVINKADNVSEDPKLTFEHKLSADADNAVFYKNSAEKASFKLSARMGNYRDDAYFSFNGEGQEGLDNFDAYKLSPLDFRSYLSLSSVADGLALDINNLPIDLQEFEFPLQINMLEAADDNYLAKSGEVTLALGDLNNIPEQWNIRLNNYNTGETVNLREIEEYAFFLNPKQKVNAAKAALSILSDITLNKEKANLNETGISITISAKDTPTSTDPVEIPAVFALEQNYPNPFNPSTTIKYSVADAGQVNLTVYNIMGQKVAELVNSSKAAGTYTVQWDAANAASGLYFYKLNSAGRTMTKQMMLIK